MTILHKLLVLFALIALMNFIAKGDETAHGRIEKVTAGTIVKFGGFLIDKPQMEHFRAINEEKKLQDQELLTLEKLGELKTQEARFFEDNYKRTLDKLEWQEKLNVIFFFGGVVTTTVIVYGVAQAMQK